MAPSLDEHPDTPAGPAIPAGYSFAARVTIAFDGGNHPLNGDLWKHDACGCLIFPGDKDQHDDFHRSLRVTFTL